MRSQLLNQLNLGIVCLTDLAPRAKNQAPIHTGPAPNLRSLAQFLTGKAPPTPTAPGPR